MAAGAAILTSDQTPGFILAIPHFAFSNKIVRPGFPGIYFWDSNTGLKGMFQVYGVKISNGL